MNEFMYELVDELNNGTYDENEIKLKYKINDKLLIKSLYKVLHIAIEDNFNKRMYLSDFIYNTLRAISNLSSTIKLNNEEILRIEKTKLEEIKFIKKHKIGYSNKEIKKIITKLDGIIIYPNNKSNNDNIELEYLINNEVDINILKSYLHDNRNNLYEIRNNQIIINILCQNFITYYNQENEKMYYYLYILNLIKPEKLSNTKIKKINTNIIKNDKYKDAIKMFNELLNGENINVNEDKILNLYNIKNAYKKRIKTIMIDDSKKKKKEDFSITIDPQKTSNVKDDALSISKTKSEYILGVHIANVGKFIDNENMDILKKRFTSIYLPNMVIDMIKEEDIKNLLSMDEGKSKHSITLKAIFSLSGVLKDFYFNSDTTKVIANYTYEEVDNILLNSKFDENNKILLNLFEITNILKSATRGKNKYRNIKETEKNSEINKIYEYNTISHGIVEEAMILYNSLIAEYMNYNNFPFIYRNHELNNNNYNLPHTLKKYFNNVYGSSYYSMKNAGHTGLNAEYYSHSSAPMRRAVDTINQQLYLNPNCYSYNELNKIVEYCNNKEKVLKLFKDDYLNATRKS